MPKPGTWYTLQLTFVVIATLVGSAFVPAQQLYYRWIFLYAVPALLALLSFCFRDSGAVQRLWPDRRTWWLTAVAVLLSGVAGALVGYGLDMTSFTYGDLQQSESLVKTLCWATPVLLLLAIFGWELPLRGLLPAVMGSSGWILGTVLGVALSVPWVVSQYEVGEVSFLVCSLLGILSLELSCMVLVRRGSGIVVTGVIRGFVMLTIGHVLSDWHGQFFTAYSYVTTGITDYLFIGGGYVLGLLLAVGGSSWIAKTK